MLNRFIRLPMMTTNRQQFHGQDKQHSHYCHCSRKASTNRAVSRSPSTHIRNVDKCTINLSCDWWQQDWFRQSCSSHYWQRPYRWTRTRTHHDADLSNTQLINHIPLNGLQDRIDHWFVCNIAKQCPLHVSINYLAQIEIILASYQYEKHANEPRMNEGKVFTE